MQGLPDENEGHDAVDIKGAPDATGDTGGIVHIARTGIAFNALGEAIDELPGFVFFGEPEAETCYCLGNVEALEVVVEVAALQ